MKVAIAAKGDGDEKRWRAALDRLDAMTIRLKLAQASVVGGLDTRVQGIVDDAPHPTARFVQAYLAVLDAADRRRETWRFRWVLRH
jgi:hypothetical protein